MLPKRTSLSAYFDMATNPENSNLDLSPISPELSVSSSSSAGSASIAPGSSSGPGLSLESLTASIVNAICPPLDSGRLNDQTAVSSSLAAMPSTMTSFSLSGPSLPVASSIAQLPASPGAGRIYWSLPLLISSLRQQCHRSACLQARSHCHVLHPFCSDYLPCPPCRPFSSLSLLGPDSRQFCTK